VAFFAGFFAAAMESPPFLIKCCSAFPGLSAPTAIYLMVAEEIFFVDSAIEITQEKIKGALKKS